MTDPIYLSRIKEFLNVIDIPLIEQPLENDTFLPGIKLKASSILVDFQQLKYPGDLLHEAGHIAVAEPTIRQHIGTNKMAENWPTDGEEIAAILWSFAAAKQLELPLNILFHAEGYKGESSYLIEQFNQENYIGLPLLVWMGFCDEHEFPKMKQWIRK